IDWCCLPRFDSPALFCRLLDARKGPFFQVEAVSSREISREYLRDTLVLRTRFEGEEGELLVTDFMPLPPEDRDEGDDIKCARITRRLEVPRRSDDVKVSICIGLDNARAEPQVTLTPEGCRAASGENCFVLSTPGGLRQ